MSTAGHGAVRAGFAARWLRAIVAAGVAMGVAAFTTWPLPVRLGSTMIAPFGDPLLNTWILAWDASRALHGFRDYWTGLFFYPYPDTLAYSEHLLGIALFTAPVQWLTGNAVLAYNLAFVGSIALTALGGWLLARDVCRRDDVAMVAGVAFACAPFRVTHLAHLQVLASGWIPISLWALGRYLRNGRRRWLAAWAAAFLLNALSNGYYLFFACVPTAVLVLHAWWTSKGRRWTTLRDLSIAGAAVLAALFPVIRAYVRVRHEQGLVRPFADIVLFSADLGSYAAVDPLLSPWRGILPSGTPELTLFPGLVVLLLAAAALTALGSPAPGVTAHPRTAVRVYAAIALAAVVLSLGPHPHLFGWMVPGPYAALMAVVPGFDGLRVPARLNTVVSLALAVLAALGLERLTRRAPRRVQWVIAAACALAVAVEGSPVSVPIERVPGPGMAASRAGYEWLREQSPGPLLELPVGATATRVRYVAATLWHGHRILNGYSGYPSPLQDFVGVPFAALDRIDEALSMVQAVGVRYVGVHRPLYSDANVADEIIRALRSSPRVLRVQDFGSIAIADVRAGPERHEDPGDRGVGLPLQGVAVSASRQPESAHLATDGDPFTHWSTGQLQDGSDWFALSFQVPQDVARLTIELDRLAAVHYPRGLVISGSPDGHVFSTLFEGYVADRLALGILRDRVRPAFDVALPPNRTRVLRVSATGHTRVLPWSIAELRVWGRRPATSPAEGAGRQAAP